MPTSSPPPITRLTTPGGTPASARILTKFTADSGRERRRLEHDGVAADERRNGLPGGDRHREVPRRDDGADAERLADGHRELVAQLRGHGLAVLAPALAGHEERHVDRFLHVAARFREHLAHLAGHVPRQGLLALGEQLRGLEQDLGAPRRRHQPPARVRAARGIDGGGHVALGRFREKADEIVAIGGISILEELARRGGYPRAVDVVVIGRHGPESAVQWTPRATARKASTANGLRDRSVRRHAESVQRSTPGRLYCGA